MSKLSRYNKSTIWNVTIPEDCGFVKLKDVENGVVRGFFTVEGKYGKQPVMIFSPVDDLETVKLADMGKSMLETVSEIMADNEAVEEINGGGVVFRTEKRYSKKYGKEYYIPVFE